MPHQIDTQIERARRALEELRAAGNERRSLHVSETNALEKKLRSKESSLKLMLSKGMNQRLRTYTDCIRNAEVDIYYNPSAVRAIEAQLCRYVHHMRILKNQHTMASQQSVELVEAIQEQVTEISNELASTDIRVTNRLMIADESNRCLHEVYSKELSVLRDDIDRIEQTVERIDRDQAYSKIEDELFNIENSSSFSSFSMSIGSIKSELSLGDIDRIEKTAERMDREQNHNEIEDELFVIENSSSFSAFSMSMGRSKPEISLEQSSMSSMISDEDSHVADKERARKIQEKCIHKSFQQSQPKRDLSKMKTNSQMPIAA